ncbi:hypothetical protein FWK35_00018020, partial [Aphis craccivora]
MIHMVPNVQLSSTHLSVFFFFLTFEVQILTKIRQNHEYLQITKGIIHTNFC